MTGSSGVRVFHASTEDYRAYQVGQWKPVGGCPDYEVCDRGELRSLDRIDGRGRRLRGKVLATELNNRGYVIGKIRDATGEVVRKTMQAFVLEAFESERPAGQEARHYNDIPTDNRWPENLLWGTKAQNAEDKFRNGGRVRAATPEPQPCVRCGGVVDKGGRRCHACAVEIGEQAAPLLVAGVPLDKACKALRYPSETGLLVLAQKYGGLRLVLAPRGDLVEQFDDPALTSTDRGPSHGVMATLRHILRRRGSDGA